mmetsp:Transcript_1590/g.1402  ORF Transcript_1590/g.1402 Transcript_1590/m.1402 type:complete len:100 (-) Transcript_1590:928-1227(-)
METRSNSRDEFGNILPYVRHSPRLQALKTPFIPQTRNIQTKKRDIKQREKQMEEIYSPKSHNLEIQEIFAKIRLDSYTVKFINFDLQICNQESFQELLK